MKNPQPFLRSVWCFPYIVCLTFDWEFGSTDDHTSFYFFLFNLLKLWTIHFYCIDIQNIQLDKKKKNHLIFHILETTRIYHFTIFMMLFYANTNIHFKTQWLYYSYCFFNLIMLHMLINTIGIILMFISCFIVWT